MDIEQVDLIIHFVFWLMGFLFLFRILYCKSSASYTRSKQIVSVIIPSRNEEKTLPLLLASLKKQETVPDEVIVVDDNSEDNTGEVALEHGAILIEAGITPEGWRGKTWACAQGADKANGEILVFLDADTILESNGLQKILDTCSRSGAVISIQPYHRMKKLYEQLSALFNIILMAAMGSFTILGNRVKSIGLFGPAMIISKKQYYSAGGHGRVKGEVVEDLALGIELKKEGVPIQCYGGRGSISFRMYPNGIRQLIEGWTKGVATGASKTSIPVLILIVAWIIGAIGAMRSVIQFALVPDPMLLPWCILYSLFVLQIYWMLYRLGNFGFYTALFYPVPLAFFVLVFAYSMAQIFLIRRVKWKGRYIDINKKEEHKP